MLGIDANGRYLADIAGEIAQGLGVLPVDARLPPVVAPPPPTAELTLDFHDLSYEVRGDRERVRGRLRIEYQPPTGARGAAVTHDFESPLGPLELGELRWYIETWPSWSFGRERLKRAAEVEDALGRWGRALWDATLKNARAPVEDFERTTGERRIVVQAPAPADVNDTTVTDADRKKRVAVNGAAARLLALPWELLRAPGGFVFEGAQPVRVVRRLPRERCRDALKPTRRILRVLLLVARTSRAGWIDPRVSLTPLVAALTPLGDRVELVVPADGSFTALKEALAEAERQQRPFHVVHFDGHGVYDRDKGLGKLVFEDENDCSAGRIEREARFVDAREIGAVLRDRRIPLFVLEACQSALIYTLDDYVTTGIMRPGHAESLRHAITTRANIVIAGGTASGKTTLANALIQEMVALGDAAERFVILEDTRELQCAARNAVQLHTGDVADLTRLTRVTMRLRPDRIIIGEVRGAEALALLKAWNTGHPGGVTTVHANSAAAALMRLDSLIQEAGVSAQPQLVAEAVDLIVFITRTFDGRRVEELARVTGCDPVTGYHLELITAENEEEVHAQVHSSNRA